LIFFKFSKDNPGVVTVDDDKRHGLYTGDTVIFEGIEGMTELNNMMTPMPITSTGLHSFTICDTSNFSQYTRGGFVTQIKVKKYMDFDSLETALKQPKFLINDFLKMERPNELHAAFQALPLFIKKNNRYPKPYNQKDAEELIELAKVLYFFLNFLRNLVLKE
jgi:ubiquitin-activating enzyme E1